MLVAQLFLLLHLHQDVNMAHYFRSENQTEQPSFADRRSLWVGKTTNIIQCIGGSVVAAEQATAVMLDVGAIVHILCGSDEQSRPEST